MRERRFIKKINQTRYRWRLFLVFAPSIPLLVTGLGERTSPTSFIPMDQVHEEVRAYFKSRHLNPAESAEAFLPHSVDEVLSSRLKGIDVEKWEVGKLVEQTQQYVRFRAQKISAQEKSKLFTECVSRPDENPFCDLLDENWRNTVKGSNVINEILFGKPVVSEMDPELPVSKAIEKSLSSEAARLIGKGSLSSLHGYSDNEIRTAFRQFKDVSALEKAALIATSSSECFPVSFYLTFGQKAEQSLPDSKVRALVTQLYSRADECGSDKDENAELARYRLGLFHIWDGKCDEAESVFKRLTGRYDGLFRSRSYYWRAFCAKKAGDDEKLALMKERLVRENPLGYHLIALESKQVTDVLNIIQTEEVSVHLRSKMKPNLNRVLQAIEALQMNNEFSLARELIVFVWENRAGLENEVKLYLAVLAERNDDHLFKFRVLSDLFERDPKMITQSTLKMYLPLKKFETISSHREKIDPFLVAALIRQESGFNEGARSRVGALGLMQLMPQTAKTMRRQISKTQILHPTTNISLGVQYFSMLINQFEGQAELALAAYNAGPNRVKDWLKRYPVENRMLFLDLIPFTETRNYVALIGRNYYWYMLLYAPRDLDLPGLNKPSHSRQRTLASRKKSIVFTGITDSF